MATHVSESMSCCARLSCEGTGTGDEQGAAVLRSLGDGDDSDSNVDKLAEAGVNGSGVGEMLSVGNGGGVDVGRE